MAEAENELRRLRGLAGGFENRLGIVCQFLQPGGEVSSVIFQNRRAWDAKLGSGIAGTDLGKRDGFGISDIDKFNVTAKTNAEVLLIEVPMNLV